MIVRPYDHELDSKYAIALFNSRGMNPKLISDLPKFGLIGLEHGVPMAMGFIRNIEGSYAMLDSYISNSNLSKELRSRALDYITYKLCKIAKANAVTKLLAFSDQSTIVNRSIKHGFAPIEHKMTLKILS